MKVYMLTGESYNPLSPSLLPKSCSQGYTPGMKSEELVSERKFTDIGYL